MTATEQEVVIESVAAYYRGKTASILEKYGPGPRVHYHTGLVEPAELGDLALASPAALSRMMVRGQERLLEHVRDHAPTRIGGRVLEVGCGLGGGALFWAREPSVAAVVAITNEPEHVSHVDRFAAVAGVAQRVEARLCDAHDTTRLGVFDHVVAIESSCYLDRRRWAVAVAAGLAPHGTAHIVDCFAGRGASLSWFDRHWRTRVGSLEEYADALGRAGLARLEVEDLAPRVIEFWTVSCAWIRAQATADPLMVRRALAVHERLQRALLSGDVRYLRLTVARDQ